MCDKEGPCRETAAGLLERRIVEMERRLKALVSLKTYVIDSPEADELIYELLMNQKESWYHV